MTGYCTCARDFPGKFPVPEGARYHWLCERPIKREGGAS
jgi:hypothetical protein